MVPLFSDYLCRQRLGIVAPYIRGDVLDLGCGITDILTLLHPGQRYVGVDRPIMIRWLRENRPGYEYHECDLDRDDLALTSQFDSVLMLAVIEHLKHPDKLLSQLSWCLKPNGQLLITTPSPFGNIIHRLGARVGLFYMEAAREHETIFTREHLQALLEHHRWKITCYRRFLMGGNQLFVCQHNGEEQ